MRFDKMAERQILKAQAEGQMAALPGAGKPLPRSTGDPAGEAGFRIMAEAGALPREITLRKEIEALNARIQSASDAATRNLLLRQRNDLHLRLDIEAEARRAFSQL